MLQVQKIVLWFAWISNTIQSTSSEAPPEQLLLSFTIFTISPYQYMTSFTMWLYHYISIWLTDRQMTRYNSPSEPDFLSKWIGVLCPVNQCGSIRAKPVSVLYSHQLNKDQYTPMATAVKTGSTGFCVTWNNSTLETKMCCAGTVTVVVVTSECSWQVFDQSLQWESDFFFVFKLLLLVLLSLLL